jgi:hypothetical protein
MGNAHQNKEKPAQTKSEVNAPATREKSNTINRNKLLLYKAVIKPILTYGVRLWGTASNSNTEILQRYQSKILLSILHAPWYINNKRIHEDPQMNTVLSEIKEGNTKYLNKLENHTNALAVNPLDMSETTRRLKTYTVLTLPDRSEQNPNTRIKIIPK